MTNLCICWVFTHIFVLGILKLQTESLLHDLCLHWCIHSASVAHLLCKPKLHRRFHSSWPLLAVLMNPSQIVTLTSFSCYSDIIFSSAPLSLK
jgi:hypothetical protein